MVLCADALRRRELVETAVRPARFGGGEVALAPGCAPRARARAAIDRVLAAGAGVVLADWATLADDPQLVGEFRHVVLVDPPPFAHLDRLCQAGAGYLHLLGGDETLEFSLRVLADEWPSRESLAFCLRGIRRALAGGESLDAAAARAALAGPGRTYPRSPEACARLARVLAEVGLLEWAGTGTARTLGVVSSTEIELELSRAFVAYRGRFEEASRFLNERQPRS